MFDRYIVLVMLQVLSPVAARLYNKNGNKPKCGKACSYLEYIVTEMNIFHMRFWTRGSVTLHHTGA